MLPSQKQATPISSTAGPHFVIVVDGQGDFMTPEGALYVPGAQALIQPIRRWLETLNAETTAGILFTFDTHQPETYSASVEAQTFPIHCVRGTPGWSTLFESTRIPATIPIWHLEKSVFNMWAEPNLLITNARQPDTPAYYRDDFFAHLCTHNIRDILLVGVAADYCVRWAIEGCVARGFNVTIPAALTCGINRQIEQVITENFSNKCVKVI